MCCSCHVVQLSHCVFPNSPHAGNVTSPGGHVGVLLNGAVNLMWRFTLTVDVTASPSILLNGTQHSFEELSMMTEVSVEESIISTSVVLTEVGVEWNGSSWRWVLQEFGGVLLSEETVLFVQGMLVGSLCMTVRVCTVRMYKCMYSCSVVCEISCDDLTFYPLPHHSGPKEVTQRVGQALTLNVPYIHTCVCILRTYVCMCVRLGACIANLIMTHFLL